jgi:hypothetical protein
MRRGHQVPRVEAITHPNAAMVINIRGVNAFATCHSKRGRTNADTPVQIVKNSRQFRRMQ